MAEPLHQIDYAPPRRRPGWLTGRAAALAVVVIGAALAAWVVVPRVWHRAELLRLQDQLLGAEAAGGVALLTRTIDGRLAAGGTPDATWSQYSRLAFGPTWAGQHEVFTGARRANGSTTNDRLLVIEASVNSAVDWNTSFAWQIIEPGTWTRRPQVVGQGVAANALPFPSGGTLVFRYGVPDPANPASVTVTAEYSDAVLSGLIVAKVEQIQARASILFHLMPDDTVRIDWPTKSEPEPPAAAASQPAVLNPLALPHQQGADRVQSAP